MLKSLALLVLMTSTIVCAEAANAPERSPAPQSKPEQAAPVKSSPAAPAEPQHSSPTKPEHDSPAKPEHTSPAKPSPTAHTQPEPATHSKLTTATPKEKSNSCQDGTHWVWTSVSNLEGDCQKNTVSNCNVYEQVYGKCVSCDKDFVLDDSNGSIICTKSSTMNVIMAVLITLLMVVILMVVRSFNQSREAAGDYYAPKAVNAEPHLVSKTRFPELETNATKNEETRQNLLAQMELNSGGQNP